MVIPNYSQLFPIMLIIEAGPMVIHQEINSCKKEQSLAEVQKTTALAISNWSTNSGLAMENNLKRGVCLSALQVGIIRIIKKSE